MISLYEALKDIGNVQHIDPDTDNNDYIDIEDGRLHCGICCYPKEYRLPFNGHYVPVMCRCREEEMRRKQEEEARRTQIEVQTRLNAVCMPDSNTKKAMFGMWQHIGEADMQLYEKLNKYCKDFENIRNQNNNGLVLYGDTGTGKTYAAYCILHELASLHKCTFISTNIGWLYRDLDAERIKQFYDKLNSASIYMIDDFGSERSTEYMKEKRFELIDAIYRTGKPVIITSNLMHWSSSDIDDKRVYDRIIERCSFVKMRDCPKSCVNLHEGVE